jgi:hypothetical protein
VLEKQPGNDHLVGLLVDLHKFHGTHLVVPALHETSGKNKLKQTLAYTGHSRPPHDAASGRRIKFFLKKTRKILYKQAQER